MQRLVVIAPCFNEQENVPELARRACATFDGLPLAAELVLVDDGSADETWRAIREAEQRDPRVRGVRHESNQGLEAAWNTGIEATDSDLVCLIDSDLQNRPEDIGRLYEAYAQEQPDIAQGVRIPSGVTTRRLTSKALNLLLNLTFGMNLRDNKSGFVLCRREVLKELLRHRFHYRYFQSFLGVAAGTRGFRITQVDTVFEPRRAGHSFMSHLPIAVSARVFIELAKFRCETLADSFSTQGKRT